MKNKSTIKIIGGQFKGTHLQMPSSLNTRSSKAILKESLFNTLGAEIIGSYFIEAFSGTGSIGLEALSRGASEVLFFEQDLEAFKILSKNIELLNLKNPKIVANAFLGDTFELLPQKIFHNKQNKILYLDPPFNIRQNYADVYEKCFLLIEKISKSNLFLVIFEHSSDYKMPKNIMHLSIIKTKKFGKSSLSYYALSQDTKESNV